MVRTSGFSPVHQESTAALIAAQLRNAIMYGNLAPGSQLSEVELSAQFGVSRGPLREAMQRLVQEGLLRSERNRGIFVKVLGVEDIHDVYAARTAVESAAVSLVIRADPPTDLSELHAAWEQMTEAVAANDLAGMSDADLHFHEVLVSLSRSPRLVRMHQTLLVETRMCMTALQDTYRLPAEVAREHGGIVDAIEARDETLALQRIVDHMQDALTRLVPAPA